MDVNTFVCFRIHIRLECNQRSKMSILFSKVLVHEILKRKKERKKESQQYTLPTSQYNMEFDTHKLITKTR